MPYAVQIVENRVVEDGSGDSGSPAHLLERSFPTIRQAEEAGQDEVARLSKQGISAFYNVFDDSGRPVGPSGPVE